MKKIVITGLGTVNALGLDTPSTWDAIRAGRSAIRPIAGFDTGPYRSKLGAELTGFTPSRFIDPMKLRRMDRLSRMVLVASMEATSDAGIVVGDMDPERIGIVIGNGYGGTSCTEEFFAGLIKRGPALVNPMLFPTTVPNSAASITSIELGMKGPNSTICQKDVSAEGAITYAAGLIDKGAADVMIAGGGDELNDVIYHAFCALWVLSPGRKKTGPEGCFPFDVRGNGRVLGEGAGVVVLETLESAISRGAHLYAELAGSAQAGGAGGPSAYGDDPGPLSAAMKGALDAAGISPADVDYVSAAANSTPTLDAMEAKAMADVFGARAGGIPVSSIRPMTGDFEGMGGLRLISAALGVRDGFIPATPGCEEPLPGIDLDIVTGPGRKAEVGAALINGAANGGACACLVIKKHK